jgi:serine/threonine protein kinase
MLTQNLQDPSYRYANTYVLKTYRSKDAKEHYTSEVKAFKALAPGGSLGKSIIGFYGSYIQDGTYNILLEYADRGTLEHYLHTTPSPTTGEDIYRFWSAVFNLIKALKLIHDVQPVDSGDPPILQGYVLLDLQCE